MVIAVGDVIRVTYWQRLFEQRLYTVLHMRCKTPPSAGTSDLDALQHISALMGNVTFPLLANWRSLVVNDLQFDSVRVQRVWPTRSFYTEQPIGLTGQHTGTANTANVAVSIEKRTLHPLRRGIGRIQMAGTPASLMSGGSWNATYLEDCRVVWSDLTTTLDVTADGGQYRFCLWNGRAVTADDDIQFIQPKDTVRTMHRRTLRIGE